jgi:hypothetical protein
MRRQLRHQVRLGDESGPIRATQLLGEQHLHGDAALGQFLFVEEDVGEASRSQNLDEAVPGQFGRQ